MGKPGDKVLKCALPDKGDFVSYKLELRHLIKNKLKECILSLTFSCKLP